MAIHRVRSWLVVLGCAGLVPDCWGTAAEGPASSATWDMTAGESRLLEIPESTGDIWVSRKGILDLSNAGERRWQVTALRAGVVLIKTQTGHTQEHRLLVRVQAQPNGSGRHWPEWLGRLCRGDKVRCSADPCIIGGEVADPRTFRRIFDEIHSRHDCRFEVGLHQDSRDAWASQLTRQIDDPTVRVLFTSTGRPTLEVLCDDRGRKNAQEDWIDAVTDGLLETGFAVTRCRQDIETWSLSTQFVALERDQGDQHGLKVTVPGPVDIASPTTSLASPKGELMLEHHGRRGKIVAEPVLSLTSHTPAHVVAGRQYRDRYLGSGKDGDRESWRQTGIDLTVQVLGRSAESVLLDYSVNVSGRIHDGVHQTQTLQARSVLHPGRLTLVGTIDLLGSGLETRGLGWLSRIPIAGPLLTMQDSHETFTKLLVWFRIDSS